MRVSCQPERKPARRAAKAKPPGRACLKMATGTPGKSALRVLPARFGAARVALGLQGWELEGLHHHRSKLTPQRSHQLGLAIAFLGLRKPARRGIGKGPSARRQRPERANTVERLTSLVCVLLSKPMSNHAHPNPGAAAHIGPRSQYAHRARTTATQSGGWFVEPKVGYLISPLSAVTDRGRQGPFSTVNPSPVLIG